MCRTLFWLLILAALAPCAFAVELISAPTQFVRVLPGQSGQLRLNFQLFGPNDSGRLAFRALANSGYADYSFSSQNALCGQLGWEPTSDVQIVLFVIALPTGQGVRECIYDVRRSEGSTKDLQLPLSIALNHVAYIGNLPSPELTQQLVDIGTDGSRIFSINIQNPDPLPLAPVIIRTGCLEYSGGVFAPTNHALAFNFPGACTNVGVQGCFNFGGQRFERHIFKLNAVAAQSRASCLVKLVPHRPQGAPSSSLNIGYISTNGVSQIPLADGAVVYVRDSAAVTVSLLASFLPAPMLSYLGMFVLIALVVVIARRF